MTQVGGLQLREHPRFDAHHLFVGAVPYMVDQARAAAIHDSYSYRDFRVGAAVFAVKMRLNETGLYAAGNVKSKKEKAKICAEKRVLNQAAKSGFTRAVGIVVAGTTDVELIAEVTEKATPTLHPCGDCRHLFEDHRLMRPDTLVITTGLEDDIYQVHTFTELQDVYAQKRSLPEQITADGFDNWSLRQSFYDHIANAQSYLAEDERQTAAMIAKMALLAPLTVLTANN